MFVTTIGQTGTFRVYVFRNMSRSSSRASAGRREEYSDLVWQELEADEA